MGAPLKHCADHSVKLLFLCFAKCEFYFREPTADRQFEYLLV